MIALILALTACEAGLDAQPPIRRGSPDVFGPGTEDTAEGDATEPPEGWDSGAEDTGTEPVDTGTVDTGTSGQVCYPGADETWTTCFDVVAHSSSWGSDYSYPEPYNGSAQYAKPTHFLDLSKADGSTYLAPNFQLDELMQEWKGQYAVFQSEDVANLQALRDASGGALYINSGYRNVTYNAGVGGATYSRHMYGDAADMSAAALSLTELGAACDSLGAGYVGYYTSHVHCDWRSDSLDPAFFGGSRSASDAPRTVHTADVVIEGTRWAAPATGFDEGEPLRRWTALDADGAVLETVEAETYAPHPDAVEVEVWIGGQVTLRRAVR